MLESKIQSSIIKEFEGWYVIKIMRCNKNGIPDLMCLKDGKTVFIEVKQPGNTPTPLQLHRHKELKAQGFEVLVMTDKKEAIEWLKQQGNM